jgi:hypothetical protein
MEEKENKKVTRVALYADLREKIERMDTLSFSDPNRDEKYGLNNKGNMPIIHEDAMDDQQLHSEHIKKNTLSISIEDLMKQNDDYTVALEKKEIDKSFKEIKNKNNKLVLSKTMIIIGIIAFVLLIILITILCCVLIK